MTNAKDFAAFTLSVVENNRLPKDDLEPTPDEQLRDRIRRALALVRTDIEVLSARLEEHTILLGELLNQWDTMEQEHEKATRSMRRMVEPFDD